MPHDQSHVRLGLVNIWVRLDRTSCEWSPLVAFQHHVEQVGRLLSPQGKYLLSMVNINYKHENNTYKPPSSLLWSQPWPRQWIPPWEPRRSRAAWRTPSPARRTRTLPCCQSGWRPAPLSVINFRIAWSAFILFSYCWSFFMVLKRDPHHPTSAKSHQRPLQSIHRTAKSETWAWS